MLHNLMGWLGDLPLTSLYAMIGVLSAFENFFPPFPSDAVIAFGSFLASRSHGLPFTVFLVGWLGNVGGAVVTYGIGRRYGARAFLHRLEKYAGPSAEKTIKDLHKKYGFWGLFVSRFLPGVRAIVPPFAGAMNLGATKVIAAVASASAVWFAFITFLAFRAGDNWDVLQKHLVRSGKVAGAAAVAIVLIVLAIWQVNRRKKKGRD